MTWYYEFQREQRGPVSEEALDQLIVQGQVKPTTLVWREGMGAWAPLSEARPGVVAGGEGTVRCDACGRFFGAADVVEIAGRPICAECKPAVLQRLQQGDNLAALGEADRTGPAWEQRATLGWWEAAKQTVQAVLARPSQTFATMRCTGDIAPPFFFFLLAGGIGVGVLAVYYFLAVLYSVSLLDGRQPSPIGASGLSPVSFFFFLFLGAETMAALWIFIHSGILHLGLMLCGGARRSYETTFRAIAYGNASVMLLHVIPIVGTIVAIPWMIVISVIALARAHDTDVWRAVLAVLLPVLLCCVLPFAFLFMVGLMAGLQNAR